VGEVGGEVVVGVTMPTFSDFVPAVLPLDRWSSLTDVRLDMVCRYVVGRDVDPVARGAALVACALMARGEERAAARMICRAEIALGLWED
jgi:hypothetical protein